MLFVVGVRYALRGVRSFSILRHHQQKGIVRRIHPNGSLSWPSNPASTANPRAASSSTPTRLFYTPTAWPENLYRAWTLEQDQMMWSHMQEKNKSPSELAVLLGRGVRGVERRIEKLRDVNSSAYQRLFVKEKDGNGAGDESSNDLESEPKKLVPSSEVLRRIEWDYQLDEHDFFVLHYDRVENTIVTSPIMAPNQGISSAETSLIKALPEHRIVAISYKERVVWDRRNNRKHDLFFGPPGVLEIVRTYDDWKHARDNQLEEQKVLRQAWRARWIDLLGSETRRDELVRWTEDILGEKNTNNNSVPSFDNDDESSSTTATLSKDQQQRVDSYMHAVFELFRQLVEGDRDAEDNRITEADAVAADDPKNAMLVSLFDELSEWIASPCWSSLGKDDTGDEEQPSEGSVLREMLLRKTSATMDKLEGKATTKAAAPTKKSSKKEKARQETNRNQDLRSLLRDEDLDETFVKGSGAGGQKVNKTSNRVVLVHLPTGIRVECQDTRSLTQNRKIGRKRLLEKLDAHFNGESSKQERKQQKLQQKKRKTKSKNKSRLADKQEKKKEKKLLREQEEADGDREFYSQL